MFEDIIKGIAKIKKKPICVGIDGINASGKTVFAGKLKSRLESADKKVFLFSVDDFKFPLEQRRLLEGDEADIYYNKWFDYDKIRTDILDKLDSGPALVRSHAWTKEVDFSEVDIVLFEGIFIFRQEFADYFDFKIFLDVDEDTAYRRIVERDSRIETLDVTRHKWKYRSMPAQKMYFELVNPKAVSDVVISNRPGNG